MASLGFLYQWEKKSGSMDTVTILIGGRCEFIRGTLTSIGRKRKPVIYAQTNFSVCNRDDDDNADTAFLFDYFLTATPIVPFDK